MTITQVSMQNVCNLFRRALKVTLDKVEDVRVILFFVFKTIHIGKLY